MRCASSASERSISQQRKGCPANLFPAIMQSSAAFQAARSPRAYPSVGVERADKLSERPDSRRAPHEKGGCMPIHSFTAAVTIPFIFGIPQIILLIVGLIG